MNSGRLAVLLVASKWWPLSARMAVAFAAHNCQVSAVCPAHHPLTFVDGIRHVYPYRGVDSLASLQRALRECRPDVVVPCDDGVVGQLHELHRIDPSLSALIEYSLGSPDSYPIVESRFRFLTTAMSLGIRVPRTRSAETPQELEAWHRDVDGTAVLKVDGESGGHGVRISRTPRDSNAAWRALRQPRGALAAWKRLAIDRDPLSLWTSRQKNLREVTVQEYIAGRPANLMLTCLNGKLLSTLAVAVVATEGPTGASTVVRLIDNAEMKSAAERVVTALKLTGFYGLDFILESSSGKAYLIEMNPRCTQLGHIELPDKGSLAGAFSAALRGESSAPVLDPISEQTIALFPQALAAGDACRPYIDASYHDMPHSEPRLMAELLLNAWPHRQWAARLYHAFQPLDLASPVVFEDPQSMSAGRATPNTDARLKRLAIQALRA